MSPPHDSGEILKPTQWCVGPAYYMAKHFGETPLYLYTSVELRAFSKHFRALKMSTLKLAFNLWPSLQS